MTSEEWRVLKFKPIMLDSTDIKLHFTKYNQTNTAKENYKNDTYRLRAHKMCT